MLSAGRLPLTEAESDAVDVLRAQNPEAAVSFTRRNPDETGPLLVHVGDDTYEIDGNGKAEKV